MKSTLTNGVGCEGWMSELPDDVLLSKLSIPGTHNSMSYTCYEANIILKIISGLSKLGKDRLAELVSQIVELKKNSELSKLGDVLPEELHPILNCTAACQSKTLTEQLQLGARFFDLRLNHELKFYHGITPLGLDMQTDAMPVLDKFLEEHPGETILLRVKSENTIEETVYRERLEEEVINKYSSRFWTWNSGYTGPGVKDEHGTVIPTLGETRGKIVLFNSYQLSKGKAILATGFASMNRKVILRCFRLPASICRMCFSRVHRKKRLLMSRKTLWLPIRLLILFTLSILSVVLTVLSWVK